MRGCHSLESQYLDFYSDQHILTATKIPEAELCRTLQSLACAKYKILRKHPVSREVALTDEFSFNHEFTSQLQKIKLGLISTKAETKEQRKETQDRVEEERRYTTEVSVHSIYILLLLKGLFLGLHCQDNEG
jgi:cullin 3